MTADIRKRILVKDEAPLRPTRLWRAVRGRQGSDDDRIKKILDKGRPNARMAAGSISHLVSPTTWMRYTHPPRIFRNGGDTHLLSIQPSGPLITPRGRTDVPAVTRGEDLADSCRPIVLRLRSAKDFQMTFGQHVSS